ncbi:heavy metal translocating P-type ATPase [Dethiosulfatarculus sandiegensis]|uniref:P-type Zn(2+) transporter n=1 Tax=Dethiosulfatarculus sandiegensis TaxID=1429043 RepID=A0A0D2GKP7_9BACT|nr:ATPase P [Dethiosulfatarculus sandiegensis]
MKTKITKQKQWISVRHSVAGRIRIRIRQKACDLSLDKAGSSVRDLKGVFLVRINQGCRSLVISYDESQLNPQTILDYLYSLTGTLRVVSTAKNTPCKKISKNSCSCLQNSKERPLRKPARRLLGLSAVGIGVFIRTNLLGLGVAQTLLSPLGLITAAAAIPMILHAWRERKNGKLSLDGFLGGSIVLAVVMGEAMTALEILWVDSAAGLLTAWITERSRKAISRILDVTSRSTYLLVDGVEVQVPVEEVQVGDTVVLHTGEKVAVDGLIIDGEAMLDESPINGRAEYAAKKKGDEVFAGTFVRSGVIYVRAEKVGDETYLARVLHMVENSLENKAPIQGVADDLAKKLIKIGGFATVGTLLATASFWRAFTVLLVMACPCATVLSASTAISAALNAAARRNILIKGGRYLEEVGRMDTACFDKTGTITTNHPIVAAVSPLSGITAEEMLYLAASAETHNQHPLARAVTEKAEQMGIVPGRHAVCEYFLGQGVRAELDGSLILVGSAKLMEKYQVSPGKSAADAREMESLGLTVLYVAKDGLLQGVLGLANPSRPEALWMLDQLAESGLKHRMMVTGDAKSSALALCREMGFEKCYYSVMPEQKARIVDDLKAQGLKVMMVGDGINDALALAQADVGVAMGAGGAEVAIEAADIALVNDDLKGVVYVHSLSRATMRVVQQNFWLATGSNLVGVVLGALGMLSPMAAGLLHIVHSLGVLANSSRLLGYETPKAKSGGVLADKEMMMLETEAKEAA